MAAIRLYHDKQKSLVPDESGDIVVQTPNGEERRRAEKRDLAESFTTVELPEGYEATMTSLSHLVESLTARHFDADDVYAVTAVEAEGKPDAETVKIAKRLAALLDAEYASTPEKALSLRS